MGDKDTRQGSDDSKATAGMTERTEGSGKVANAHNSTGEKAPTQIHQGQRTPNSRGDRDSHLGSGNQMQSRQGGAGGSSGGGSRGAG